MAWDAGLLRLGTCSWTAKGWEEAFYPPGVKAADYIAHYAERFSTVEIDASFYGVPRDTTLMKWQDATPPGFLFAAKAPKEITHDRFLVGCEPALKHFLTAMEILGDKCGPLLFQFPYFAQRTGVDINLFLEKLALFLPLLPESGFQFAVEVRNKAWISAPLLDLLGTHNIALALIDHPWMSRPNMLFRQIDLHTAPFLYIRWLGDRYAIEKKTKVWKEVVVNRDEGTGEWIPPIQAALERQLRVYGYVNNHYGGYAPHDVAVLESALEPHLPRRV
ncbi:MAG: DUF72 domain-containing protein [Candidatus Hydrogenedentes bacterium]|nr:DUF72 domain-containing protein [Candidatus Hydrogenedentota bacterium]